MGTEQKIDLPNMILILLFHFYRVSIVECDEIPIVSERNCTRRQIFGKDKVCSESEFLHIYETDVERCATKCAEYEDCAYFHIDDEPNEHTWCSLFDSCETARDDGELLSGQGVWQLTCKSQLGKSVTQYLLECSHKRKLTEHMICYRTLMILR